MSFVNARRALLLSATAMLALPGIASAQTADQAQANQGADRAADDGGLQDIVVTAERREENLQRVPVSVTAVQGD